MANIGHHWLPDCYCRNILIAKNFDLARSYTSMLWRRPSDPKYDRTQPGCPFRVLRHTFHFLDGPGFSRNIYLHSFGYRASLTRGLGRLTRHFGVYRCRIIEALRVTLSMSPCRTLDYQTDAHFLMIILTTWWVERTISQFVRISCDALVHTAK